MSRPESSPRRDADGCGASSALSAPSGFWLCHRWGRRRRAASNPGSTGWSGPSPAGLRWSGGPCIDPRLESRGWTAGGGGPGCQSPPARCWLCDWRGPPAGVWPECVWSFSLWTCTGRCHHQTAAVSGWGDRALSSGCGPRSGSRRWDGRDWIHKPDSIILPVMWLFGHEILAFTSFLLSLFSFCRCHFSDMWGDLAWHSRNVVLPSTPYWTVSRVFLLATT